MGMIKPDGVQRGLVGEIISRFEKRGYFLLGMKYLRPTKEFAEEHYSDLSEKPFFGALTSFLSSGPVVAMVWTGKDAVRTGRRIIGATNPLDSAPGTIRGDYSIDIGRNVIHGSDAVDSAEHEIDLWFDKQELTEFIPTRAQHLYE